MAGIIQAILTLKTAGFKQGLNQAKTDTQDFKKSVEGMFGGLGRSIAGVLTVGGTVAAFKSLVRFGSELSDMGEQLDISSDKLQKLLFAFDDSKPEEFGKAMGSLLQKIEAARAGNEPAVATFERLGVSWKELHTLAPDQVLMRIADAAKESNDPTQLFADVVETLGKKGRDMLPQLKLGSAQIRRIGEDATVAGDAALKAADDMEKLMGQAARGVKADAINWIYKQWDKFDRWRSGAKDGPAAGAMPNPTATVPSRATILRTMLPVSRAEENAAPMSPAEARARGAMSEQAAEEARVAMENMRTEARNRDQMQDAEADKRAADAEALVELEAKLRAGMIENEHAARMQKLGLEAVAMAQARQGFIDDKLAGPDAVRQRKRAEADARRAGNQFDAREQLRRRGGRAAADMPQAPLAERLRPRMRRSEADWLPALAPQVVPPAVAAALASQLTVLRNIERKLDAVE